MSTPFAIFVNLDANNGRAAHRWAQMADAWKPLMPPDTTVILFRPPQDIAPLVSDLLAKGCSGFVSAGGDGSANFLLNLLMQHTKEQARHLMLGGIGLGSSNDFIKPKTHFIQDLPIRLDYPNAQLVDVGKAEWLDASGDWHTRYFIANASLGVTAEANWFFNHGDWLIQWAKHRWTNLAILYAALRTILQFKNFPVTLSLEQEILNVRLSNLAVLKTPFVSGSFHFDDPVQRDDGFLGMNACLNMRKMALVKVLIGLSKGRFKGTHDTISQAVQSLKVIAQTPVALEMDGEVFQASEVRFSVVPKAIQLMGL